MISTARLVFTFLAVLLCCLGQETNGPYDVILAGGKVVDGTGNSWFYGDVALRGDRIARITAAGQLDGAAAKERIDCRGLVISPGFVDIQGGVGGRSVSKITQGVTTEISGEGSTSAPANEKTRDGSRSIGRGQNTADLDGPHGFDAMLRVREAAGSADNFGSFVGAATVRQYVKGMAPGEANPEEIAAMQQLVKLAMQDGAFGVGSALIYPPGVYSTTHELAEMTKPAGAAKGIYITHIRSEADKLLESLDEAFEIGRLAGTPVEIYHLKASGKTNWAKEAQAIAKIDAARQAGLDVSASMYPYTAGATGLTSVLPPWASEDGKLFDNLADAQVREKLKAEMAVPQSEWENMGLLASPEGVLISRLDNPANQAFAGKRLSQIAAMQNKDWRDAAMDLILTERTRVETTYFMMSEENVRLQLRQPWMTIGTDAGGVDPEEMKGRLVHPRAYGSYPKILGRYVREDKLITLEDAVRKMTSLAARRLSIRDRGLLQEGLFADIAVFNPDTIIDLATYENPNQISVGVEHVFVNGVAVVKAGKVTGAKPGVALRGPGWSK